MAAFFHGSEREVKISLIAARAENNVIGLNNSMPWNARGEQLLFKALTFNQWLIVGRKTFESMGVLADRKFAVLSRGNNLKESENVRVFGSLDSALDVLGGITDHVMVAGGGEVYRETIEFADCIHLTTVHLSPEGDAFFPEVPGFFERVFSQEFSSNINYIYEIFVR